MPDPPSSGSAAFRRERIRRNLSQRDLAQHCGLSIRTIRGLERGGAVPRRSTLERVFLVLKAQAETRAEILRDLDLIVDLHRHAVEPDDMLLRPAEHEGLLRRLRTQMSRYANIYTKRTAYVLDRVVEQERWESAIVASEEKLAGAPLVIPAQSSRAARSLTVVAREGCEIQPGRRSASHNLAVADLSFHGFLAVGEGHTYAVDVFHSPARNVPLPAPGCAAGGISSVGMRKGGRLAVVVVQFQADDLPRRCTGVFESKLGAGYEQMSPLVLDPSGRAELVVADPVAGWHGIAWEW